MYSLLYGLSALGRRKGLNIKILLPAAIRSGAFLGVFAGLFAVGNCVSVQKLGGNYPRGYFVSAFFAAFCSILVEQRSRRAEVHVSYTHTHSPIRVISGRAPHSTNRVI